MKKELLKIQGNLGAKMDKAGDVYVFKTCEMGHDNLKTDWFFIGTIDDIRATLAQTEANKIDPS